jgi:hypothetical protein
MTPRVMNCAPRSVNRTRLRSFELFRDDLRGVDVVTFHRLAAKAEGLLPIQLELVAPCSH